MGYSTDFYGSLSLSRELTDVEKNYINDLASTRRMQRDSVKLMERHKGEHGYPFAKENTPEAVYGFLGEFYVNTDEGQFGDDTVIDNNAASGEKGWGNKLPQNILAQQEAEAEKRQLQPGLWCQWIINDDNELEWDGGEKFYNYVEWLKYLIDNLFTPWGVMLNGEITWQGEQSDDMGKIEVKDNQVTIYEGRIEYVSPKEL